MSHTGTQSHVLKDVKDESICAEADRLVSGARQGDYGHPLDNWTLTAEIADPIIKKTIATHGKMTAEGMLLVMQAVKIARELHVPKRDNRVDGAGYWKCEDMCLEERKRRATVVVNGL